MKLATWNVNSLNVRLPRLLEWLPLAQPDILCLQETKLVDTKFPHEPIAEAGYHAHWIGQPTYNGVAYLDKPAFYFKAVALSLACFGNPETAARIPSAAFGIGLLAMVWAFAACTKFINHFLPKTCNGLLALAVMWALQVAMVNLGLLVLLG